MQAFAAADVNDVWVGGRDRDDADRTGRLVVEDRVPRAARVGRLPDAAVDLRHVEREWPERMPGRRHGAARTVRADGAPLELREEGGVDRRFFLRRQGRPAGPSYQRTQDRTTNERH